MKDVKVVAMADLIPGKAEKFMPNVTASRTCKFYPDHKSHDRQRESWTRVSVCTYNTQHAALRHLCAGAGRQRSAGEAHVPLPLEEAVEIMQRGKEERQGALHRLPAPSGREHADDQEDRRSPAFSARSTTSRPAAAVAAASRTRTFIEKKTAGIGALGDIGCYSLDMVLNAIGYPKPLTVTGYTSNLFRHQHRSTQSEARRQAL